MSLFVSSASIAGALIVAAAAMAQPADPSQRVGAWVISDETSPLTNADVFTASLDSSAALLNQIGLPQKATLVMRCAEGRPAFYVNWPQVIERQAESVVLSLPETLVLERIDNGKIKSDFWVISESGTAAGSFDKFGAPRLIASVTHAKRLVVRMTGTSAQDAVFELDGVERVAQIVSEKCGLRPVAVTGGQAAPAVRSPDVAMPAPTMPPPRVATLGVGFIEVTNSLAAVLHQDGARGVFVTVVKPDSIALKAGLSVGDIVTKFDGRPILVPADLQNAVRDVLGGRSVEIEFIRAGAPRSTKAQF